MAQLTTAVHSTNILAMSTGQSPFICFEPAPQAKMRLYCFPYAGGSAAVFRDWGRTLAPDLEVWAAQLPGRGAQYKEPAFTSLEPLVAFLGAVDFSADGRPFAFFGHSLGAWVAFELARLLRRQGKSGPVHLFVSSHRAPQLPFPRPPIHTLPQAQLIAELKAWNGIPEEILADQEVLDFFLPILRADLTIAETAVYHPEPPLAVPLTALGGEEDSLVSQDELDLWRSQTSRNFEMVSFVGDHFYLYGPAAGDLLEKIHQALVH